MSLLKGEKFTKREQTIISDNSDWYYNYPNDTHAIYKIMKKYMIQCILKNLSEEEAANVAGLIDNIDDRYTIDDYKGILRKVDPNRYFPDLFGGVADFVLFDGDDKLFDCADEIIHIFVENGLTNDTIDDYIGENINDYPGINNDIKRIIAYIRELIQRRNTHKRRKNAITAKARGVWNTNGGRRQRKNRKITRISHKRT